MLTTLQCNVVIKKNYFYKLYKKKQYCNYSVIQSVRFTNNCVGMYQLIITLNIIYGTRVAYAYFHNSENKPFSIL